MAREVSPLLVRWARGVAGPSTTVGESDEIDFDMPRGLGIAILGIQCRVFTIAATATAQFAEVLVTLDGADMANDAVNSQALFEAAEIREDVIANFGHAVDLLTSGGATIEKTWHHIPPRPILTARNPGFARLGITSNMEGLVGIEYVFVELTDQELVGLIAQRRT